MLRRTGADNNDCYRADDRADHPERAPAQRSAEGRLADDGRRCASPLRVLELEPEGDIKGGQTAAHTRTPNNSAGAAVRSAAAMRAVLDGCGRWPATAFAI